jgi:hypothetical protein
MSNFSRVSQKPTWNKTRLASSVNSNFKPDLQATRSSLPSSLNAGCAFEVDKGSSSWTGGHRVSTSLKYGIDPDVERSIDSLTRDRLFMRTAGGPQEMMLTGSMIERFDRVRKGGR